MTEIIKENSKYLRGTLESDLQNQITGSLTPDNHQLIKFHGIYEQDDRDRRIIRAQKKLEKDYSFMIRMRIPGGRISAAQWIGINKVTDENASNVIKITTRQTVQLHGILKHKLKPTVKYFDKYNLDSIAACGDVNRNVISSVFGENYMELHKLAVDISEEFLPKTNAYKEIWLDGEKITKEDIEPLYKNTYLPRKFKIAIANPPFNDVDVYAHDIGVIAIKDSTTNKITGYNVVIGGGMGMTHGNAETYPRIGNLIGYIEKSKIIDVIREIMIIQRDNGNRENRKRARLKYTIDTMGLDTFQKKLNDQLGYKLKKSKYFEFKYRADLIEYNEKEKSYGIFIENGRVHGNIKCALLEIAEKKAGNFVFTNNQNVIIADVENKDELISILNKHGMLHTYSNVRKNAMACVALNTCPLALAEGQRYMPSLIDKIELIFEKHKIDNENIIIRMTGCPNGCARPYIAEIGFVGKAMGKYNMYLGADSTGTRLSRLYKESLDERQILNELENIIGNFAKNRSANEQFGDFIIRNNYLNNELN